MVTAVPYQQMVVGRHADDAGRVKSESLREVIEISRIAYAAAWVRASQLLVELPVPITDMFAAEGVGSVDAQLSPAAEQQCRVLEQLLHQCPADNVQGIGAIAD